MAGTDSRPDQHWSAVVLAAGHGTRLGELTEEIPKPLLPLGGRPFLEHLLERLEAGLPLDRIVLVSNGRYAPRFRRWLGTRTEREPEGSQVHLVDNETTQPEDRLGAMGDLALALERHPPEDRAVVLASDTLVRFSLAEPAALLDRHPEAAAVVPVMDEPDRTVLRQRGVVRVNDEGRIVELHEKPAHPLSSLTALPIYLLRRRAWKSVPQYLAQGHDADALGGFLGWLAQREVVMAYRAPGGRLDIGTPDGLRRGRALWKAGEWSPLPPAEPDRRPEP